MTDGGRSRLPRVLLLAVFFLSGAAAILYQLVWQRALFTIYGTSAESVTLVVTAFMLGLGLGSLAGGRLSSRPDAPLLVLFGAVEGAIGLFGLGSLPLFRLLSAWTVSASGLEVGLWALVAVLVPTLLMGATLPLLVAHEVRATGNVGRSVGLLYAVNTLGSAVGALGAAGFLLGALGQAGTVAAAAAVNFAASALVLGASALLGRAR